MMNDTSSNLDGPGGIIDNVTFAFFILVLQLIVSPITAVLALCAGITNTAIFARMDLNLGVNINLLILSVSDLAQAVVIVTTNVWFLMLRLDYNDLVGRVTVSQFLLMIVNYPINVSIAVTAVIAVVRSLSVVMPLTFRTAASRRRQLLAIIFCSSLGISIPLYTQISYFVLISKDINNVSQSDFMDAAQLFPALIMVFDIFRNIFFYSCFVVSTVSMIFLSIALKKSSKFQTSASAATKISQTKKSSTRDVQIVKTVILILAVHFFCNLPLMTFSILRRFFPQLTASGQYRNASDIFTFIVGISTSLNIFLNTPVYFFCNSRYRMIAFSSFVKSSIVCQ
ncbi:hypothetical protein RRG08_044683 [Elysia crispata]|uniref:G-protein coupled receptors family 1 profile domain-containing protein n=1 Tax=Elysia crispata TaxID=231223 RepID=A0AAE1DPN3_9GAST|nr:hypothetical protein RRG08_044683 [Elysia crispata]